MSEMVSELPTTEPHSELGFLNNQEFQWDVLWKTIPQEALEHLETSGWIRLG